jgi:C-type mannose receptor
MLKFFAFFAFISGTFAAACSNGGIEYQAVCYYFQPNETTFANAEEACVQLGGHLASVHDGFANAFIAQQASFMLHGRTGDIWIGATDLLNPGTFTWTDGSDFIFTEWQTNKTVSGEDCGSLDLSAGQWLTQDCSKQKAYVCAVKEINISTTTTTSRPTTTVPAYHECGYDWIYLPPTKSCYGKMTKLSFNDAIIYCQKLKADLVSIHDYEEMRLVSMLQRMMDKDLWIGLYANSTPTNKDSWKYTDGTDVDYDKWSYNYPKKDNLCGYVKDSSAEYTGNFYNDRW